MVSEAMMPIGMFFCGLIASWPAVEMVSKPM